MSDQPQTRETASDVRLTLLPGSGEEQNSQNHAISERTPFWADGNYRKLAICSLICGLSCIGFKALIYSVKAEEASDPAESANFSQRAKKFGILSIVLWFSLLASIPILMALVSYSLTLLD